MKNRDLLDMLGDIDDGMIEDAAPDFSIKRRKKRPQNLHVKVIAIAACCTLILCGAMVAAPVINKIVYPDIETTETGMIENEESEDVGNNAPTGEPTGAPTEEPTMVPMDEPTEKLPSAVLTDPPVESPTEQSTFIEEEPTGAVTGSPTLCPTGAPMEPPVESPTGAPIESPTESPTGAPTGAPIEEPTENVAPEPPKTLVFDTYSELVSLNSATNSTSAVLKKYIEYISPTQDGRSFSEYEIEEVADLLSKCVIPVTKDPSKIQFVYEYNFRDEILDCRCVVNGILYSFEYSLEKRELDVYNYELVINDARLGATVIDIYKTGEKSNAGVKNFDDHSVCVIIRSDNVSGVSFDIFDFVTVEIDDDYYPPNYNASE